MSRTNARRVIQSLLSSEWAIRPDWLEKFVGIAEKFGSSESATLTAEELRGEIRRALAVIQEDRPRPEALAFSFGEPISDDSRVTLRDGVAILPIIGPLYHYADALHDVCGCSSYSQVAADIAAIRDQGAAVKATVLEIDSPGGEVGGCAECARMIEGLAEDMPVVAYVTDLGCSAAYWLASATGKVITAPAAITGSIGVVGAFRSRETDTIEIVSSQSPKKRPDVTKPEGRAQVQATLDALADVFINEVARYRGVTVDTVLVHFGQGDILVGKWALEAGLTDRIATFEEVLHELAKPARTTVSGSGRTPAMEGRMKDEKTQTAPVTVELSAIDGAFVQKHCAEVYSEIHAKGVDQGKKEGVALENERIIGIEGLALPGHEELLAELKADTSISVDKAAARIIKAEREARAKNLESIEGDEKALKDAPKATTVPATGDEQASDEAVANRLLALQGSKKNGKAK